MSSAPDYIVPARGITFAPNVEAETYGDPPPLVDPPPSSLFPTSPDEPTPRRASHARKKPDDWIPRPPNAFILFRSEMVEQFIKSQHVPGDVEANHGNLSKIIGLCWRNLPFPERSVWEHKARLAQAAHKAQYPHYRFRPHAKGGGTNPGGPRRRVKEPPAPPDARRVAHIAGLLVDGVKGAHLARAVRALDEGRSPSPVQMRFDEPVTAAQFDAAAAAADPEKRPSSAPAGEERTVARRTKRAKSSSPAKKRRGRPEPEMETEAEMNSKEVFAPPEQAQDQEQDIQQHMMPELQPEPMLNFEPFPTTAFPEEPLAWSPTPGVDANTGWASPTEDGTLWSPAASETWNSPVEQQNTHWTGAQWTSYAATTPGLFAPPPELDLDTALSISPAESPQRSPSLAYAPAPAHEFMGCAVQHFPTALREFGAEMHLHEYARAVPCFEF